ncbi:uroporphyrinogen-III synthase [Tritonibacter multivorans]|uniref:Uroporphyrinogen-III synthase n=2 Tax=Tritonibacter multivorans TaxID=928856 RepID=A0A0P1GEC5_9RHOB|nr:uroporphyrinogen-III synthase [Tritonibacter multivorans]CUH79748.1 uroporphyrinogen-III synthase [Tritonibacter multivorans]SFC03327.1 uroporphyrinogen-III synthase [Tritonibacter multivorans]
MAGLLMTRPTEGNTRFLALLPEALKAQFNVVESPLIQIASTGEKPALQDTDQVIFTSQNGVEVASVSTSMRRPALCIGPQTTQRACELGWDAKMAGENSGEFLRTLLKMPAVGRLLHLRGTHSRGAIAQTLRQGGIDCREQVVYSQDLLEFSATANRLIKSDIPLIVTLFSPRTARHFAQIMPHRQHLTLIVLSDAVAEPLRRLQCEALHVSKTPNAPAMAALLNQVADSDPWVERLRSKD